MISLIIPPKDQISRISKMLADEFGTASNIKSRVNRLSVLGAITSVQHRLKLYTKGKHVFGFLLNSFINVRIHHVCRSHKKVKNHFCLIFVSCIRFTLGLLDGSLQLCKRHRARRPGSSLGSQFNRVTEYSGFVLSCIVS